MAFEFKHLTRVAQTGNLDKSLNVKSGMDSEVGPQRWQYNGSNAITGDTHANLIGGVANYFADAYGLLNVGDELYVTGTDTSGPRQVTASSVGVLTLGAFA